MPATAKIEPLRTTVDIAADQLDHELWNKAMSIPIIHYWSGEQAPTDRHGEARITWSAQALNVRFICRQHEPLVVRSNSQTKAKTIGLWDRDVCEIFIAPDLAAPNHYFEFEAAPTGEWIDLELQTSPSGRETNWEFHSRMTAAARIEQSRIVIAIRIPWSESIPQPRSGDQWRINLCRCIGKDPQRGYLAWQPTRTKEPNFHVPEVFGTLVFSE